MNDMFLQFHFLRPWFLLALVPAISLYLWNQKIRRNSNQLSATFASHLLPYLIVEDEHKNILKPQHILLVFWLITILAIAGPSWQREPSPFAEDQAALVIIIKTTSSMTASDIQPSRLERSVHKISDLLARRKGAKTALVAYAGTAHRVMPFTTDSNVIVSFASELSPEVMPKEGDDPVSAIRLASSMITDAKVAGSILLIVDSIPREIEEQLKKLSLGTHPIQILAVGARPGKEIPADSTPAPALDLKNLQAVAGLLNANLTEVTASANDVEQINFHIVRSHKEKQLEGQGERWKDGGFYFLPVLIALSLFWCRRGWVLSWERE
jgi:Ca-activated chloride channel homolog